jgi:hypothetical protein
MKTNIKKISIGDLINFVCFVISIILVIVGFVLPPTGEIDNSVLIAVGELGFFSTLSRIPELIRALKNGASVDVSFGDKQIHIEGADDKETA